MKKYIIIGGATSTFTKEGQTLTVRRICVAEKATNNNDFGNIKAKEFKITQDALGVARQNLMREVYLVFDEYGRVCDVRKVS